MKNILTLFTVFVIYPMTVNAEGIDLDPALFDELPVEQEEIKSVTNLFWNAQSIQNSVKQGLPHSTKSKFRTDNCEVKSVVKTEPSVDICDLKEDSAKQAKFTYNFNISCSFGNYKVAVCSRKSAQLMDQLKVMDTEKIVSDENPFDLESTM